MSKAGKYIRLGIVCRHLILHLLVALILKLLVHLLPIQQVREDHVIDVQLELCAVLHDIELHLVAEEGILEGMVALLVDADVLLSPIDDYTSLPGEG